MQSSQLYSPSNVLALTGITSSQFAHILTLIEPSETAVRIGRPPSYPTPTKLLIALTAMRLGITERALAVIFEVSQPTVSRIISDLLPRIAELLPAAWPNSREHLLIDGTLIPVHDQQLTAKSKNYRRSVNTQIVATRTKKVVAVGKVWPGNRHDIIVARETVHPPAETTLLGDGAYRSFPNTKTPPPREDPKNRRRFIQVRARIEHVIARLKDWQILRQCRRKGEAINHALKAVAFLYNLRFDRSQDL